MTRGSLVAATALGGAQAAVSIYWFFGSALLDTVGGSLEEWAVRRGPMVTAVLSGALCLKLATVFLGFAVSRGRRGPVRRLAWVVAMTLSGYGAVNTATAQLMLHHRLVEPAGASAIAVSWHAWVWDPSFMLWGLAMVALLRTTPLPRVRLSSE